MKINKIQKTNFINEDEKINDDNEEIITNVDSISMKIDRINRNIDTDQYSSILKYNFKGQEHRLEVKRTRYLVKREIIKLQDFGLDVTEYNADKIIKHLQFEEKNAPMTLVHSNIGFDIWDEKYVFKHYGGVNVESSYNGKLDIVPKGTYENWHTAIMEYVIRNIPLETALVIGFSSAVVGLLSLMSNYDSLLAHFSGDSTTGKTTASMLAIQSQH